MENRNNQFFSINSAYQQEVLDNFNDRVREIEQFFGLLAKFQAVNPAQLISVDEHIALINETDLHIEENVELTVRNILSKLELKDVGVDMINILKSNAVLLLYNLIESTVSKADTFILGTITNAQMLYAEANPKIKEFWVRHTSKFESKNLLVTSIKLLDGIQNVKIDVKKQVNDNEKEFQGNLDAQKIDDILSMYGIETTKIKMIRQESERIAIKNIAQWRSDLAHGKYSFAKFGQTLRYNSRDRDRTNDILFLKDSCFIFLQVFLENIEEYIEQQKYKKQ